MVDTAQATGGGTLVVDNIYTSYGLSQVLFGVSFTVQPGEVVALIGRNGVGKTTTMRSVIGLTPASQGDIQWDGQSIRLMPTHQIAKRGIGYVPEDRRIFPDLTVWENLDIARQSNARRHTGGADGWNEDRVYELFPDLAEIRDRRGGVLSGGQQQMLTIARSLMGNPALLLLDEPSEGLAPLVVEAVRQRILQLKQSGISILLAEQNLEFVLSLADAVHILEKGEVKYSGSPQSLRENKQILDSFLTV